MVIIATPRLSLRLLTDDDIPALLAFRQLPDVMQYLSNRPVTANDILEEIAYNLTAPVGTPGYRIRLVLVPNDTNEVIGECILKITEEKHYQGELTYVLHPAHQGKGYATEAVRALICYAFSTLRLHRLTATIFADHTASIKVAERVGMRQEAYFRQVVPREGRWLDDTIYALLREEWEGND